MAGLIPTNSEADFKQLFEIIKERRSRASRAVNNETLLSAWEIGSFISERMKSATWGSKTATQFSEFLRTQDPSLRGYSCANIYNMVAFYESYSTPDFISYTEKLNLGETQGEIVQLETEKPNGKEIVQFATGQNNGLPEVVPAPFLLSHYKFC